MRLTTWAALLAATLACSSTDPSTRREIGVIVAGGVGPAVIEAPDTVVQGQPFSVVVNTFGSSSCTTPAGVSVEIGAARRTITPYDRIETDEQVVCTRDMVARPHPVVLTFNEAGAARILARGYLVSGTVPGRELTVVGKDLWVKP